MRKHSRSLASGGVGLIMFAASFLHPPTWLLILLIVGGILMLALAAALWSPEKVLASVPGIQQISHGRESYNFNITGSAIGSIGGHASAAPTAAAAVDRPFIDEYDDAYQLRQALTGALTTLNNHKRILSDRKLFEQFDPKDRGHWNAPGDHRKFLLKAGHNFIPALKATDAAFGRIGLLNPATMYNDVRLEALAHIDEALARLEEALTLVEHVPAAMNVPPPAIAPLLSPYLRYTLDNILVVGIANQGLTIREARMTILAPRRYERQWVARMDAQGHQLTSGTTDEIDHELVEGCPKSLRWSERGLTLEGIHTTTEMRFFLPRYEGDPIDLRIGADVLPRWERWVFTTPRDDVLQFSEPERVQ